MQRPMPIRFAATALVLAAAALTAAGPASAGVINDTVRAVAAPGAVQPHPAARPAPAPVQVAPAHDTRRAAPAPVPVHEVSRPAPVHEFHRGGPAYVPAYPAPRVVVTQAPVYVQAQPQYVPAQPQYAQADWNTCGAPRWNPDVRYMPGQVVRRHGNLYIATDVSAAVWNVNSPPEWTPNYWVPAVCGQ